MEDSAFLTLTTFVRHSSIEKKNAVKYGRENYSSIMKLERFSQIPFYVLKIILEKDVNANQMQICDSILLWTNRNKVPPNEGLHMILETVKVQNLSMNYITQKIEPYIGHLPHYSIFMTLHLQFNLINKLRETPSNEKIYEKPVDEKILFVVDNGRGVLTLEMFDLINVTWKFKDIPIRLNPGFGVGLTGNSLFFIGTTEQNVKNEVYLFNMCNGACQNVAPLNRRRSDMAVAILNLKDRDSVYVIGGYFDVSGYKSIEKIVERWDSNIRKWINVSPMHYERACASAVVLNGKIYVAGGYGADPQGFEEFDPQGNRWKKLARMNEPRRFCKIVAHNGMIYAVGGSNYHSQFLINTVECYDFSINKWRFITSLPRPLKGFPCSAGNRLFFAAIDVINPCMLEYIEGNGWKQLVDIFARKNYVALFKYSPENF